MWEVPDAAQAAAAVSTFGGALSYVGSTTTGAALIGSGTTGGAILSGVGTAGNYVGLGLTAISGMNAVESAKQGDWNNAVFNGGNATAKRSSSTGFIPGPASLPAARP